MAFRRTCSDRTITRLSGSVVFLVAAIVGGCGPSSSVPASPSSRSSGSTALTADQLSGTWTLVSMRSPGREEQPVPANAIYTLTLDQGRLSTRVDCNTCGGVFTLSGQMLTVGPGLACTRAACATMSFENAYTSVLTGESTLALSNGTVELSSPRGVLRFTR